MLSGKVRIQRNKGNETSQRNWGRNDSGQNGEENIYTGGNNINLFKQIKMAVSMIEAAEYYDVEVKRGKAICPFHNDRHPSLFVADDHYHCFACGEHGDVIDFVAKLYGLSQYEGAKKLAYDFGIRTDKPPDKAMQEKWNKKTEALRLRETEKLCFSALMAYYKLLQEWMSEYAPKTPEEATDSRFAEACHNLPRVEHWVDFLLGSSCERNEVIARVMADGKLEKLQNHLKKHGKEWPYEGDEHGAVPMV